MSQPDPTSNPPRSFAQLFGFSPATTTTTDAASQQLQQRRPVWSRVADALGMAHLVGLGKPARSDRKAPTAPAVPTRAASQRAGKPPAPARLATAPRPPVVNRAAAAQDAALAGAHAKGHAAGWAAERTRWRSIFEATPAAAVNRAAYVELASDPTVTVHAAVAALNMLPAPRDWRRPERQGRNPRVGV